MKKSLLALFTLFSIIIFAPVITAVPLGDIDNSSVSTTDKKSENEENSAKVNGKMAGILKRIITRTKAEIKKLTGNQRTGTVVRVRSYLNFRQKPWGKKIGKLYAGQTVTILGKEGDWYKISSDGKTGYAHSAYIREGNGSETGPGNSNSGGNNGDNSGNGNGGTGYNGSGGTPGDPSAPTTSAGDIEITGIPTWGQSKTDPYCPNGTKGWRPSGYCGPTSLQKVLHYYGVNKSRDYLALTRLDSNGNVIGTNFKSSSFRGQMYAKGTGSSYAAMVKMAKHSGFPGTEQIWNKSIESIRQRIQAGRPQIVSVKGYVRPIGQGGYNTGGHILVVQGITKNGDVIINDSARGGRRSVIKARDFMNIWRGFHIDIKK